MAESCGMQICRCTVRRGKMMARLAESTLSSAGQRAGDKRPPRSQLLKYYSCNKCSYNIYVIIM